VIGVDDARPEKVIASISGPTPLAEIDMIAVPILSNRWTSPGVNGRERNPQRIGPKDRVRASNIDRDGVHE
jgi:hypothetical protein